MLWKEYFLHLEYQNTFFFSMSTRAKLSQKEMSRVNFLKLTKKAISERFGN